MTYKARSRLKEFYRVVDPVKYEEMETEDHKIGYNAACEILSVVNKILIISLIIGACYYFISQ